MPTDLSTLPRGEPAPDPALRTHGWLAWPVWLGIWIATVPAWCAAMLVVPSLYGDPTFPRFGEVFGYDGFVNLLYSRLGSSIAPYGGWYGAALPALIMAVVLATSLFSPARNTASRILWGSAPLSLLLLAATALLLQWNGLWEGLICVKSDLLHRGRPLKLPLWRHVIALVAMVGIASAVYLASLTEWFPARHDRRFIRWIWVLAVMLWCSALLMSDWLCSLHSTRVLAELAIAWGITASVIVSYRHPQYPSRLALKLAGWGAAGNVIAHVMLYLVVPAMGLLFLLVWAIGDSLTLALTITSAAGAIGSLQLLHREMLRLQAQSLIQRFACRHCDYDLRGSVAEGRHTCRVCGELIDDAQHQWVRARLSGPDQGNR
jgi:hypothetical protein